ncbi:uncharacterized protein LOC130945363 [Arachis stenosperma]|uniref:uncharacterized protein LOC130945363 n=1 Tax=Arachis stenosperma TaxID=217475 RepID=UPI0025ABC8DE|nr:uncharacterized protein LOC130945363 [Arachis stenosperma]
MAESSGSNLVSYNLTEGQSSNRLPLFNGKNYTYWKERMKIFVQAVDYRLWKIILEGSQFPTNTNAEGVVTLKPEASWTEEDRKKVELNTKAKNGEVQRQMKKDLSKVTYYNCKEMRHFKSDYDDDEESETKSQPCLMADHIDQFITVALTTPKKITPGSSAQKSKGFALNNTKESANLETWDFKKKLQKSHSHYDPSRFNSCVSYEFHKEDMRKRHLCATYLIDLNSLTNKGIHVSSLFDNLQWTPLLHIQKPVYPGLVCEFYANMRLMDGIIHSYVKGVHIILDIATLGMALGYKEKGPRVYMSKKWDLQIGITYQMALNQTCESLSRMDGTNPTLKELGPDKTILLYKLISHVLIPQSSSRHRVTISDFLALVTSSQISFAYLMIRHMWKSVKDTKKASLPYGMFLTSIFEYFEVDLTNEAVENKVSVIKGG